MTPKYWTGRKSLLLIRCYYYINEIHSFPFAKISNSIYDIPYDLIVNPPKCNYLGSFIKTDNSILNQEFKASSREKWPNFYCICTVGFSIYDNAWFGPQKETHQSYRIYDLISVYISELIAVVIIIIDSRNF